MAVDVQGKAFEAGQKVARAVSDSSGVAWIKVQICTKVDGDKVFLNGSKRAMMFPKRLCIVGVEPGWPIRQ